MAPQALVKNSKKYGGKYVATRSFTDKNVLVSGDSIAKVYEEAKSKGIKDRLEVTELCIKPFFGISHPEVQ